MSYPDPQNNSASVRNFVTPWRDSRQFSSKSLQHMPLKETKALKSDSVLHNFQHYSVVRADMKSDGGSSGTKMPIPLAEYQ